MFRIRLASGEEAVYRTVEELALGIHSGVITAAAEVYDPLSSQWILLATRPEYGMATARAATLTATAEMEPGPVPIAPLSAPAPDPDAPPVQIYQMFSRSAAELAERHRFAWLTPALRVLIGLLALAAVALAVRRRGPALIEAERISSPRGHGGVRRTAGSFSPESLQAIRLAPYNLAARLNDRTAILAQALSDSAGRLGLTDLLGPGRLGDPDSLRAGQTALAAFDTLLVQYRLAQGRTERAYRDSAAELLRMGSWEARDEKEWVARAIWREPEAAAVRADSLYEGLSRLYTLLLEQAGHYEVSAQGVRFSEPRAADRYDLLRRVFEHNASMQGLFTRSPPPPLRVLLEGLHGAALPPRLPR